MLTTVAICVLARDAVESVRPLGRVAAIASGGPAEAAFGGIEGYPTVLRVSLGRVEYSSRVLDDVRQVARADASHGVRVGT
jgi:hypothetical protein